MKWNGMNQALLKADNNINCVWFNETASTLRKPSKKWNEIQKDNWWIELNAIKARATQPT